MSDTSPYPWQQCTGPSFNKVFYHGSQIARRAIKACGAACLNSGMMNIAFVTFFLPAISLADVSKEKLPIPRFVTIKFDEVNARTGPAVDCPIEWVFISKGEPVEIIAQYEQWRKIRDMKGEGGWTHSSALSSKRSVVLIAKNIMPLIGAPGNYDDIVAKLKPKIRCNLIKCKGDWCQIKCQSYKGWIARKFLWGVYPKE